MIKIETTGGYFDLSPATQFTWVMENPFFEEDEDFSAPLSLPFTLPRTPNNAKLLGFADDLQVSFYPTVVPVVIYVQGALFFRGQLNVWRPGSEGYQVSASFNKKEQDTDKSIRDFAYGGARVGASLSAARAAANLLSYPDTDFVWPMLWNVDAENNDIYGGRRLINWFGGGLGAYADKEIATPMPFLSYVLRQVLLELGGIKSEGRFFELITDKLIYNPVVTNTMVDYELKLYTKLDPAIHQFDANAKELEIGIEDASTFYSIAAGAVIIFAFYEWTYALGSWSLTPNTAAYTTVIGDVSSPQTLLQNIFTYLNTLGTFTMVDDQTADPDNPRMVITNITRGGLGFGSWVHKEFVNYYPNGTLTYNDVGIGKHLPDISVSEFINAIKDGFNVSTFLNPATNVMTFTPRIDFLLQHETKDYTSKLLKGHEKEVISTGNYRFVWVNDTNDFETSDRLSFRWHANNHPESAALNAQEIELGLSTTKVEEQENTDSGVADMPKVGQPLEKYDDESGGDFSLRLLTWKGMQPDSLLNDFPQATDEALTPNEMYNAWFKKWYRVTVLGRDYVNFTMLLDLQDILHFNPSLKWRVMHNNYIWKKIEVPVTMNGFQPAKVQLMRINNVANIFTEELEEGGE
jgi:hypothetical protein